MSDNLKTLTANEKELYSDINEVINGIKDCKEYFSDGIDKELIDTLNILKKNFVKLCNEPKHIFYVSEKYITNINDVPEVLDARITIFNDKETAQEYFEKKALLESEYLKKNGSYEEMLENENSIPFLRGSNVAYLETNKYLAEFHLTEKIPNTREEIQSQLDDLDANLREILNERNEEER